MPAAPRAGGLERIAALDVLAFALFIVTLIAIWTEVQPFVSLQNYAAIDDTTRSNGLRKAVTILLVLTSGGVVLARGQLRMLVQFATVPLVLVIGWFALTSLASSGAGLALNRLGLAMCVMFVAASLPLMLRSLDACISALGIAVTIMIAACFLGVMLVPELAMHTVKDVSEQTLAGDWRGIFAHKNELAAMTNPFVFIGILVARTRNAAWGLAIVASSFFLTVMSGGKSALLLIVPALLLSLLVVRARSRTLTFLAVFGCVGGVLLLTLGSVAFTGIHKALAAVMPDPSFTGRTDIWELAMDAIGKAKLAGYGYFTFWDTGLVYGTASSDATAALASHAHNGYLETALAGGLPGLALVLVWTAIMPWRNITALRDRAGTRVERAFLDFLAQVWLFGLLISCLEAVLFNRGNPTWFTMLFAIACLQYWIRAQRAGR
ncbi:MAG: O-antigen ligase family protein [Flavobacteriaceae bacterium]